MAIKMDEQVIEIKPVEIVSTTIRIQGDTPLIMHKWSEKAKRMILDKQTKATKTKAQRDESEVRECSTKMTGKI